MSGGACAGFLISLGPRGIEAYDNNERSLGIFESQIDAASAVISASAPAAERGRT
jgi:hypothetical protein